MSFGGKSSIRVLLVDPQTIVRAGLRLLIESWPGLKVIGEAGTPVEAHVIAARENLKLFWLTSIWDMPAVPLTVSQICRWPPEEGGSLY